MRILVTGAAGLIGRELVAVLAERRHRVVALLHRARTLRRNDGAVVPATALATGGPAPGRVATITGDVGVPDLGLDRADVRTLAVGLDLVVHAAAVTGFDLEAAVYERVNIGGTRHALAFAAAATPRPLPVLAVSTAYVCGELSGPVAETPADPAGRFVNGCERTEAVAEGVATEAARSGLPVAIARPSIVVGAHADGVIGEFTNLYGLIRFFAEGRIRTLPAAPEATLDLVPIGHVVAGLADLAERIGDAAGRIVHLVSGRPLPVAALRTLADDFPALNPPRFVAPERFDPSLLGALERRLELSVTSLRRLIAYALAAGFIVPPQRRGVHRTSG